ncbi:LysR substrate-binding domain-containing protein [Rhodoferax ferrireducens]|nr:LysR family transcriptional regulator [Rhodoferax ferrireducens]WPC67821.1 LysR substrate-binding domain-containing protein [Rhodoferax ferrireducens]
MIVIAALTVQCCFSILVCPQSTGMNLSWLLDFQALATSGNFSRAAADRAMTQPAFSRRIRALETWLGVTLFDRSTHPATLTEVGEWFRAEAQTILARVARVPDEARAVAASSSATLRFAATHALSLTFLPAWLRTLETRLEMGSIQLVSDVLQQCEALMLQGRAQFMLSHAHVLVPGRLDPGSYLSVKVGTDTLIPVSAGNGSGAPRHCLGAHADVRVPLLSYSDESGLARVIGALRGDALEKCGTETVFTAHLAAVLKSMALDGRGVAWLPVSLIQDELQDGRLVEAAPPDWRIELDIRLFRNQATAPPAAEAFWRAVDLSLA